MHFLRRSHAGTLSKCTVEWEDEKRTKQACFQMFCCWVVGNLQVRLAHFMLAALDIAPFLLLFSLISAQCGQQGNLSLSYSDTDANILYMRVLILDRPVPMPALSVLFLTTLAVEWDMNFAWATPGALLLSHAPSLEMSRNELQVMSAVSLHGGYISVNPFSYQYNQSNMFYYSASEYFFQPLCTEVEYVSLCEIPCHAEKYCITEGQNCHSAQHGPFNIMPCTTLIMPAA